jgi:hypothetical protein
MARDVKVFSLAQALVAVTLVVALACEGSACRNRSRSQEGNAMDNPSNSLKNLSRELDLALPATARLVGIERQQGADDLVRAKISMTPAEWAEFATKSPVRPERMRPARPNILGPDEGFWDPNSARELRLGQVERPGSRYLNIGYNSNAGEIAVYIFEHGT